MQSKQEHLLSLIFAKENEEFQQVKKRFSGNQKYFFNYRRKITIVYDKPMLYIVHKEYLKMIELKKPYAITDLAYNYKKNAIIYYTADGQLNVYFASTKSQLEIKKDFKKIFLLEWLYSAQDTASFFVAEEAGIRFYRIIEEQRKSIKQVKHISGKFVCYLYQPKSEFLVGFQYGECENALLYHFQHQKTKNWFRNGQIEVRFTRDEYMAHKIKSTKNLGLEGNRISKELFNKKKSADENFIDIQTMHGVPYLIFYYASQGKLQLTPLAEYSQRKQLTIKLPSDSPPSINVYDNMLVFHLKNQKITFIYQINANNFQALVSPYPLQHEGKNLASQIYGSQFVSTRALLANGHISKWKIHLPAIYAYLKVEMQIFDFLNRRVNSKIETIKWMRENLFRIRQIDLSKMWKSIFGKIQSGNFDQNQIVSMIEIYTNLFFTLSIQPTVDKLKLVYVLMECLRQAHEYHTLIPDELQLLTTQLLLSTSQYDLLLSLSHHGLIGNSQKIVEIIFQKGQQEDLEVLMTLSMDMACQCAHPKEILKLIMKSQRPRQGKGFIKLNVSKIEPQYILQSTNYLINQEVKQEFLQFVKTFFAKKKIILPISPVEKNI